MQRRGRVACARGQKKFTVVRVGNDDHDTYSGRSFEESLSNANPDRGSKIHVYVTCAKDAGEARLPSNYKWGTLVRVFKYRGRRPPHRR